MPGDTTRGRKLIVRKSGGQTTSARERNLSIVAGSKLEGGIEDPSAKRTSTRDISSVSQLPLPEAILSGEKPSSKRKPDEKNYVLNEIVSKKALVFRANNSTVWLLHVNDLSQDELIGLAETKSEIKKAVNTYRFARCPEPVFDEFYRLAKEQDAKRQAMAESAQHRLFEDLVKDAVHFGVSDIHVTLGRGKVTVEYRIDGLLQPITKFSWSISVDQTTSLIRSVFNTIAEGTEDSWNPREPQDASIVHAIDGKNYQLRYAHDNVEGDGFHVVLRVLDDLSEESESEEGTFAPLQKLGLYDDEVAMVDRMMESPYGFLCVSGTTGSGKSTFLKNLIGGYSAANRGKNILTVENPVEYLIFGAKQTSCPSPEQMAAHLVSVLRRDPDAILIGEIRDPESAKITIEATQTGHFVWSTLHASNALAQVSRLEDIGISRSTLAAPEFVAGMVHLALARKVCTSCRVPIKDALTRELIPKERFDRVRKAVEGDLSSVYVANPQGCSKCSDGVAEGAEDVRAGFKGRMSVPEMVLPTLKILKAIKNGDDLGAYEAWRQVGGKTLQEGAIRRLKDGYLCANEVEAKFKRLDHDEEFYT